uniref:Uncharacterized protein n=1 Tax=Arundo donax TaxID=35708 RepID=A0A0A8ZQD8_ARUDO
MPRVIFFAAASIAPRHHRPAGRAAAESSGRWLGARGISRLREGWVLLGIGDG